MWVVTCYTRVTRGGPVIYKEIFASKQEAKKHVENELKFYNNRDYMIRREISR